MADPTNPGGPVNPIKVYGTGGQGTSAPAGTPPNRNLQEAASGFADAGKETAANMDALNSSLEKAQRLSREMGKTFGESATSLKRMIEYADDVSKSIKNWQQYMSKLTAAPGLFSNKSRKEIIDFVDDLLASSKRLMTDRHFLNPNQQRDVANAINNTTDAIKDMKKSSDAAFDARKVDEVARSVENLGRASSRVNTVMGSIPSGRLSRDFKDLNRSLRGSTSPLERIFAGTKLVQQLRNVRTARKTLADIRGARAGGGGPEVYARRIQELRGQLHAQGINLERAGERGYQPMPARSRLAPSPQAYRDIAGTLAGSGSGWMNRRLTAYTLRKVQESQVEGGPELGRVPGFLLRQMQTGGGGVLGGAGGGAGMFGELAGRANVYMQMAKIATSVWDKNALENRRVMQGVGGGGLLGGMGPGETAATRMADFRNAINTPLNTLGMTFEKNLKMMQDVVASGLTIGRVGKAGQGIGGMMGGGALAGVGGAGPAGDFMTAVGRGMYIGGATLGMDPTVAVQTTIKLLQTYRQSFAQSEGFFQRLAVETQAAGISTMKYIDLIDGLESHFNSFNRHLNDVVDTLALMGRTGSTTAEDLKDTMDTLMNHGAVRTTAQSAYLNKQMLANPEYVQTRLAGMHSETTGAAQEAAEMLQKQKGFEKVTAQDILNMHGDYTDIRRQMAEGGMDVNTRQTIGNKLAEVFQNASQEAAMRQATRPGGAGFVGLTYAQQVMGQGPNDMIAKVLFSLDDSMKKAGETLDYSAFSDPEKFAKLISNPIASSVTTALGTTTDIYKTMYQTTQTLAAGLTMQVRSGALTNVPGEVRPGTKEFEQREYLARTARQIAGPMGWDTRGKTTEQMAQMLVEAAKANPGLVQKALLKSPDFVKENLATSETALKMSLRPSAADEAARKLDLARQANIATKPTSEVYADAFQYLFTTLATPLNKIVDLVTSILTHMPGFGDKSPADVAAEWQEEKFTTDEKGNKIDRVDQKRQEMKADVDDLQAKVQSMDQADPERATYEKRLEKMKLAQANFEAIMGGDPTTEAAKEQKEAMLDLSAQGYELSERGVNAALAQTGDERATAIQNQLMAAGGIGVPGTPGAFAMRQQDRDKNWDLIDRLREAGVIKETAGEKGHVVITYVLNNTNNLHNLPGHAQPIRSAPGEKPKSIPATTGDPSIPKKPTNEFDYSMTM